MFKHQSGLHRSPHWFCSQPQGMSQLKLSKFLRKTSWFRNFPDCLGVKVFRKYGFENSKVNFGSINSKCFNCERKNSWNIFAILKVLLKNRACAKTHVFGILNIKTKKWIFGSFAWRLKTWDGESHIRSFINHNSPGHALLIN